MNKVSQRVLLLLGLGCWCLSGTVPTALAGSRANTDTLHIGVSADLGPLDLARSMRMPPALILRATNETLIRRGNDPDTGANLYSPGIASSWSSSDEGRVWEFRLNPGHRFDDGSEVTAEAVRYTFDRIFGLGRGTSSSYSFIKQLEVVDDYSVRFHLDAAHPLFLPLLADSAAAVINPSTAQHAVEGDFASQWLSVNTAGSGPFRLARYEPGSYYVLERNPHFHGEYAGIQQVIIRVIRDESLRRLQMEKGDLDMVMDMGVETIAALERAPGVVVHSGPSNAFLFMGLNTERGIMSDPRVREAISYTVDYEAIVDGIFLGRAEIFRGPLPPGQPGASPELYPLRHDPARARRMLQKAGIRPGQRVHMLYTAADPTFEPLALVLQAGMQAAGLTVRLQQLSLSALIDTLGRGDYDTVLTGWVGESNDPAILINYWLESSRAGSAGNVARYRNGEVDRLLRASVTEQDADRRAELIRELIAIANSEWPYIYLVQRHQWMAVSETVRGLAFNPNNAYDHRFERLSKVP